MKTSSNKKKATDEEILEAYLRLKSCKKVAKELGMCHQSVHERCVKLKINSKINILTEKEKNIIKESYEKGFKRGENTLKQLSTELGRTINFISRYARELGLTSYKRKMEEGMRENISRNRKKWHEENEHPRGAKGLVHTPEAKKKIAEGLKNFYKNVSIEEMNEINKKRVTTARKNGAYNHSRGSWKAAWRTIGTKEKFYRSRWEANFARFLEFEKKNGFIKEWEHEPQTFWFDKIKRGVRSYLPDFKITKLDGSYFWVEVKGYYDPKSITKIKRFKKYYPKEVLELRDAKWFKENSWKLKVLIPDWE